MMAPMISPPMISMICTPRCSPLSRHIKVGLCDQQNTDEGMDSHFQNQVIKCTGFCFSCELSLSLFLPLCLTHSLSLPLLSEHNESLCIAVTPGSGASVSKAANRRERERKIQATFFFFFSIYKAEQYKRQNHIAYCESRPSDPLARMECTKVDRKVAGHDSVQFAGSL